MSRNNKLISQVKGDYGIDVKECIFLREGADNDVFVLFSRHKKKYVARIGKRVLEDILFELNLVILLLSKGIKTSRVIKTLNGDLFTTFNGSKVVILEFIEGYHVEVGSDKKPDLGSVSQAAKMLAQIHNAFVDKNVLEKRKRNIFTEIDRALGIKNILIEKNEGGRIFIKEIQAYKKWINNHPRKEIIIHNDYRPGNIFFRGKDLAGVIDFDWACRGPAIKDVALALVEWSFPDGASGHWDDVFLTFIDGYNSVVKEKIVPKDDLYKWICFSCLSDTATYLVDMVSDGVYKRVEGSYMYKKYLYFRKFANESIFL